MSFPIVCGARERRKKKEGGKDKMMHERILSFKFVVRITSALSFSIYMDQEDRSGEKRDKLMCKQCIKICLGTNLFSSIYKYLHTHIYIYIYTTYTYMYT